MALERYFIEEGKIRSEIENFLRRELHRAGYSSMKIQKTPLAVRINIYVEKPQLVIGKKGKRISKLTKIIEEKYNLENLAIDVQRVENPTLDPNIVAKRIATALEKNMNRRKVVYKALRAIMNAGAKGAEIIISGKIVGKGGRARAEKYSQGYMKKAGDSVNLVRVGSTQAYLKAGIIGVTVKIVPPDTVFPDQINVKPKEEVEEEKGEVKEAKEEEEKSNEEESEKSEDAEKS
ncbi:MAG: 30S ribosomal protein S3 [Candidatus Altiarchaeales archaeon]|nr:MAG: 30S ribosomal protein S3 [Candidatus Altiarchaeales archaeon]